MFRAFPRPMRVLCYVCLAWYPTVGAFLVWCLYLPVPSSALWYLRAILGGLVVAAAFWYPWSMRIWATYTEWTTYTDEWERSRCSDGAPEC